MVLGTYWMRQYSPILFDFQNLSLTFKKEGRKVTLTGTSETSALRSMSGKALAKICKKGAQTLIGHLFAITAEPIADPIPKAVEPLLRQYSDIFKELKRALTTTPVLAMPNFTQTFILETDACKNGVGAVLMQNGRPISYFSKALGQKYLGLSTYEKELLAILMAVQHWRNYLQGVQFTILTDQESIKHFADQRLNTILQQKWSTRLLGYDFHIKYRRGEENRAADALSRLYETEGQFNAITILEPKWIRELKDSYQEDEELKGLIKQLTENGSNFPHHTYNGGLLRYKNKLMVGEENQMREKIIDMVHNSSEGGHSGINGTYKKMKSYFYWKGMKGDIQNKVTTCDVCQINKAEHQVPAGLLQPLPVPDQAWKHLSMDFIEGLPRSEGRDVIFVVVDRFTKYSHFIALSHPFTAHHVAKEFMNLVYRLHGLPESIVSDRDSLFLSGFWKELFHLLGTELKYSSAYHPQTDGQTERINACLESYLRCMVGQKPKSWNQWLPLAEWWYNTHFHSSLNMSPFQALYGYNPPLLGYNVNSESPVANVEEYLNQRQLMFQIVKHSLEAAQGRMKSMADKKRQDREFKVGDLVYLRLQPYRQTSVALRRNMKLAARYYGPYEVLARVGKVAYKLELPVGSRIHPVFHVSQLKKKLGHNRVPIRDLPYADEMGQIRIEPMAVLSRRMIKRNNRPVGQMLIQWTNSQPEDATWEDASFVEKQFPSFHP